MDAKLRAFPLVDIDHQGRFKYILVKVFGKEPDDSVRSRLIVRGTKRALWHCEYFKSNNLSSFHCQLNAIFLSRLQLISTVKLVLVLEFMQWD